jgi:putative toxin-antitoxin system antitoxin component (TIGR02293 family)
MANMQARAEEVGRRVGGAAPPDIDSYWEAVKGGQPTTYLYVCLLGLRPSDPIAIVKRVRGGLKFQALERFQRNTRFSTAELADLVAIKLRTLHRRREQGRLEPDESDRLLRVSRVFAKALELFEGDADAARRWFHTPAKGLGGEPPIAVAGTDVGSREVEALIDRLEHGVLT